MSNIKYQISNKRIGNWILDIENWKLNRGFSLAEVVVVMGIILVLFGIGTISLFSSQHKSSISATLETFLADVKEQQTKAMVGDTQGTGTLQNFGVYLNSNTYTLFSGTYVAGNSSNYVPSFPSTIQITTTFPSSQLVFLKGSGEVPGFINGQNTITFRNTVTNEAKTVTVNRYGVVTGVN